MEIIGSFKDLKISTYLDSEGCYDMFFYLEIGWTAIVQELHTIIICIILIIDTYITYI